MYRTTVVILACVCFLASPGPAEGQHAPNSLVVAEIQNKLYRAKIPKHGDVQVSYENGIATLTGTVDSIGVKEDAVESAEKVDDVTSVVDNITAHAAGVTPQQILERARKEIVTYPFYTIFDHVVLRANGDTLTVSGQVTDPFEKEDIGSFLSHVKGVATLQNDLEVLPVSIFDDQIRLAVARSIYRDPFFVNYANQALPSIHVIVKNGDVTLEGVVDSAVAKAKAEADSRFAITYFSLTNNLRVENP